MRTTIQWTTTPPVTANAVLFPCHDTIPEQADEDWSSISIPMDVLGALLESLPDSL